MAMSGDELLAASAVSGWKKLVGGALMTKRRVTTAAALPAAVAGNLLIPGTL